MLANMRKTMQIRMGNAGNLSPMAKRNEEMVGLQVKGSRKEKTAPKLRPGQEAKLLKIEALKEQRKQQIEPEPLRPYVQSYQIPDRSPKFSEKGRLSVFEKVDTSGPVNMSEILA